MHGQARRKALFIYAEERLKITFNKQCSLLGADYGVQITTDRPEPGGSSGAPLKEGISWGKLHENSKYVDVFCDVTIALPLIWGYVKYHS